jgi:hypothetical protein
VFLLVPGVALGFTYTGSSYRYYFGDVYTSDTEVLSDQIVRMPLTNINCVSPDFPTPRLTGGKIVFRPGEVPTSCSNGVLIDELWYGDRETLCGLSNYGYPEACAAYDAAMSPEPSHCSNGVRDGDEVGIDCGGSCAPCNAAKCPEGYFYDGYACRPPMPLSDALGNCPPGMARYAQTNLCYDPAYLTALNGGTCPDGYIADAGVCAPEPLKYNNAGPEPDYPLLTDNPSYSEFASGSSSTNETKTVITTDNGDGTSTRVSTSTYGGTTSGGGAGSVFGGTKTTVEIIDNGTGEVISSSTETTQTDENPLSNPGNYTVGEPNGDAGGVGDRFAGRIDSFIDTLKTAPVYSAFNNVFSVPSGGTSSYVLDMGSYGAVTVDLNNFSTVFAVFGWALVFASLWIAGKLVIANKG